MPIDVAWKDNQHTIILKSYSGRWTADELHASEATINAMINSVSHRVDVIADLRITAAYPSNTGKLFEHYFSNLHPRLALSVVVGRDINLDMMRLLADKYDGFARRYAFARSPEEAERIIADDRAGRRIPRGSPPVSHFL